MVDISGGSGAIEHGFNNMVFILPAILVIGLISFFSYKLYKSLREKGAKKGDRKKNKQQNKKDDKKKKK